MEEPKKLRYRLLILCGLFMACLVVYFVTMFDAQVVNGARWREQSVRMNTSVETVEASRGVITDRNGKVLVSNHAVYTLTFDPSLVAAEELNDAVLRLLSLLREQGVEWYDELPLTAARPYDYDYSVPRSGMLVKYLTSKKWIEDGMTADEMRDGVAPQTIFDLLCGEFGVREDLAAARKRELVGFRYSLATARLDGDGTFLFASGVDVSLISLLKDGGYDGVRVGTSTVREYKTDAAAHVLGRVGKIQNWDDYKDKGYEWNDLVGVDGVEAAFEDYLRGTDGTRIVTTNADGKVIDELWSVEPEPGGNVALTLDIDFQEQVEQILADSVGAMTEADGIQRGAAAAVIQIGTGDTLALASYPTFSLSTFSRDYNDLLNDPALPMLNRATQWAFAPGSTFKPAVAVAALETGAITPQTRIRDLGAYRYYDMVYNCWIYSSTGGTHGLVNVTDAITVSCTYFFYEVGRLTGISTIDSYAAAFGLGEPTGVEIPERVGTMTSPDYVNSLDGQHWTDGLTLQAAIGQAYNLFTPLQLANYIATLAGGGTRYNAHLLKDVSSYDSAVPVYVYDEPPADTVSISDENLKAVLAGMRKLVTDGSVRAQFRNCVVDAAAKTGTAQTGGRGTTSNGVFVAFAPYDDPQIALALIIEKGGSGGALAQTAVDILNAYFTAADPNVIGENILLK
ncbi:MAG: penicillin-binding protein A [Oscillospiraceae bacterium]|nr:penicillin-binding protein A [Oscillospiraceae bacterium]